MKVVVDSIDRGGKVSLKVNEDLEPKPGAKVGQPGQGRRDRDGGRGHARSDGRRGGGPRGRGPRGGGPRGGGPRSGGSRGGPRGRSGDRRRGGDGRGGRDRRRARAGDRRFASFEDAFKEGF